ncbi:MAG: cupin [Bacteroidales bacterium]|nr:cupin [Bacteroidales bacterium]MBK7171973.1 cupin [Bacteroidales bacterium]
MKDIIVVEKSKAMSIAETIEYVKHSVVIKPILSKVTGNISTISFDAGESLLEKIIPFDRFVQIIEGISEIVIDGVSFNLRVGQSIIIPAHSSYLLKANVRFKMISTIIKSGYE